MFPKPHLSLGLLGSYGHEVSAVGAALSSLNEGPPPTTRRELDRGFGHIPSRHRWGWKNGERTVFRELQLGFDEPVDTRWFRLETPQRRVTAARLPSPLWLSPSRMSHFAILDALLLVVRVSAMEEVAEIVLKTALSGAQHLCGRRLLVYLIGDDGDEAEIGRMVLTDVVRSAGYATTDVLFISGPLEATTMRRLLRAMDEMALPLVKPGPLRMITTDAHRIAGRGTVLVGRVMRGEVRTGDEVELVGRQGVLWPSRVVSMKHFRRPVGVARSGDTVGVLLPNVAERVCRGALLVTPGSASPRHRFVATLRWGTLPPPAKLFRGRIQAQMFAEGATVGALLLKTGTRPRPGEHFFADVVLSTPLALEPGMRFVLHDRHEHLAIGTVHELKVQESFEANVSP